MDEIVKFNAAVFVEIFFKQVDIVGDLREVKIQHLVMIAQWSGVAAYTKGAKEIFEVICLRLVIISSHHTDEKALAEPSRADKEEAIRLCLQLLQIHGLIYIIHVPLPDRHEVRHAIRYLFDLVHTSPPLFMLDR